MIKVPLNKLDLDLYHKTLTNGLKVYMIPNSNINNIYVTYTAAYGSCDSEFIPYGETQYKKVPDGIAHFLEHKVFEQESGEDPFQFFSKNGADVNAYTSFFGTTYLFSGIKNLKENLEYLLKYVESPYFTNENVEKEKGIILQELKMHQDNPYRAGEIKIIENAFIENPIRIPVIGTSDSIKSITKEDLYTCYNTFYHPSNMILVITGNFEPKQTLAIIENVENKRNLINMNSIKIKKYNEPNEVFKKQDILKLTVSIPKVFVAYKFNIEKLLTKYEKHIILRYINIFMNIKFGNTSIFQEKLMNEQIINEGVGIDKINTDKHLLYILYNDTEYPEKLIEAIEKEMENKKIDEEDFNRKKKLYLSSNISLSDDIYRLNEKVINDILLSKKVITDFYEIYNLLNIETMYEIINELDFSNITKLIIKD